MSGAIKVTASRKEGAITAPYAPKSERPHIDVDSQKLGSDPDDTLAWQRAVTLAIKSGVKRVRGKSPVYNCSGQINYAGASGLVIEGSGMGATVINVSGTSAPVEALFYTSSRDQWKVQRVRPRLPLVGSRPPSVMFFCCA